MKVRTLGLGLGAAIALMALIAAVSRDWVLAMAMVVGAGSAFVNALSQREPDLTLRQALRNASRLRLFLGFTVLGLTVLVAIVTAVWIYLRPG